MSISFCSPTLSSSVSLRLKNKALTTISLYAPMISDHFFRWSQTYIVDRHKVTLICPNISQQMTDQGLLLSTYYISDREKKRALVIKQKTLILSDLLGDNFDSNSVSCGPRTTLTHTCEASPIIQYWFTILCGMGEIDFKLTCQLLTQPCSQP